MIHPRLVTVAIAMALKVSDERHKEQLVIGKPFPKSLRGTEQLG